MRSCCPRRLLGDVDMDTCAPATAAQPENARQSMTANMMAMPAAMASGHSMSTVLWGMRKLILPDLVLVPLRVRVS